MGCSREWRVGRHGCRSLRRFSDSGQYSEVCPEELIVAFSSPQTDEKVALKVEKFFGKMSGKRHRIASDYSRSGLPNTYLLKLSPGDDPLQVAEKYLQDPEVLYVEPNYEVNIATVPDDTSFASLWGPPQYRAARDCRF